MLRFTLFGDSITQLSSCAGGLAQVLSESYIRRADVINRGLSGYNSRWGLEVLSQSIPSLRTTDEQKQRYEDASQHQHLNDGVAWDRPDLVTLWFGANDAALSHIAPQHVPIDEYRANLVRIVRAVRARQRETPASVAFGGRRFVVIITPPPVDEAAWHATACAKYGDVPLNRLSSEAARYAEAARAAAAQVREEDGDEDVLLLDAFKLLAESEGSIFPATGVLSDGLHLSEAGYKKVSTELIKLLPSPEEVRFVLPEHCVLSAAGANWAAKLAGK